MTFLSCSRCQKKFVFSAESKSVPISICDFFESLLRSCKSDTILRSLVFQVFIICVLQPNLVKIVLSYHNAVKIYYINTSVSVLSRLPSITNPRIAKSLGLQS